MRKYRNYSNDDIIKAASQVKSMANLLRLLDLKPAGGNYIHMKKILQELRINCDHWTGQAWNKNEQLKSWSKYKRITSLKRVLIKERGNACEDCGITRWKEQMIKLEIHHIDGDRTNNKKNNLKLLCPNCHSFTDNFRGLKLAKK